jgi:hypothetical protein
MLWRHKTRILLFLLFAVLFVSAQVSALEVLGGVVINDSDFSLDGKARVWVNSTFAIDVVGYPFESITILRATGDKGIKPFMGIGLARQGTEWTFSTDTLNLAVGLEMDMSWMLPGLCVSIDYSTSARGHTTTFSLLYNVFSLFDFSRGYGNEDLDLLARLISAEARGEPYEGQVAVGAVVLNRVNSPNFPNTIREVIYQKGQFTSAENGAINAEPTASSTRAAKAALSGEDPSRGALYFCNPLQSSEEGLRFISTRTMTVRIGQHVFYK